MEQLSRGEKTKYKMIAAAFDLFHEQGVNATSVDQILEKSETGKSQFYHYFKNKEDIVHAVLQGIYMRMKSGEPPFRCSMDTWDDLKEWFYFFIEGQKKWKCARSCPIGMIANEISCRDELIRQDIALIWQLARKPLIDFFNKLKVKGELVEQADPDALANFCLSLIQGGTLMAKAERDITVFQNAAEQALNYLHSLKVISKK